VASTRSSTPIETVKRDGGGHKEVGKVNGRKKILKGVI